MEKFNLKKYIRTDFCFEHDHDHKKNNILLQYKNSNLYYMDREEYSFYKQQARELYWRKCLLILLDDFDLSLLAKDFLTELIVFTDSENRILGYVKCQDLLKELSSDFEELQAYFHTVMDTIENSVSVVDKEGKTIVWTEGAEKVFSIRKEDILGENMKKFFPEEMLLNQETLLTGKTFKHHLHKPREDLFVLININPVVVNGDIIGAVAAETDITSHVMLSKELLSASSKIQQLQKEVSRLNNAIDPFQKIKGSSIEIKNAVSLAKKMAKTEQNVLLLGETGVGKEVFAKAIHDECRLSKPFIALNCGAISPALFESELFGYEKGAFSGGDPNGKPGKIELADEGTLFLDEVGDLPLDQQVKLLRVLENKAYYSVGGLKVKEAKCRIIAATNKNLEAMAERGEFREDLFYRLNTLTIFIPPLRKRRQDILELFHLFIHESSLKYGLDITFIAPQITKLLLEYEWKGNIRELRNAVDRMVLLSENGSILPNTLPEKILKAKPHLFLPSANELQNEINRFEKQKILDALKGENGNKSEAAKRLGITRTTLYNKMKKLNITDW
ncbi:sigma 54-interacting transcriptional regulator [Cytobacillus oceanisediminis]|uniref:sigma-54 interaction domain-containing protein n=1 Tax=Cytobacillus oceanisediminis TaxID=665099 RepID=UPI0023DB04E0|nr:sigma 54-interacting transcriptional regulator [Cytobacillus oceanisediminis]MDF2036192.1 sigma 54-interacting transcriptional regulator [Cytobacillus oceanisediminis]